MEVKNVKISEISELENIRMREDDDLAPLMSSIKANDLLQPVGVFGKPGNYILVWGHRRLKACDRLGWKEVPVVVLPDKNMSEEQYLIHNTIENLHRRDITVVELGKTCKHLRSKGFSVSETASRLGVSTSKVKKSLWHFEKLPKKYREKVVFLSQTSKRKKAGKISATTAHNIYSISRDAHLKNGTVDMLFDYVNKEEVNLRQLRVIGMLARSGVPMKEALKEAEKYYSSATHFAYNKELLKKALKKEKSKTISQMTRKILNREFPRLVF